ncbi:hypothetical protein AHF37_05696 [Paragonimus kellicotti]|nr:hypothetical protein AHF37_05696 [Paragonimus kellicotti]
MKKRLAPQSMYFVEVIRPSSLSISTTVAVCASKKHLITGSCEAIFATCSVRSHLFGIMCSTGRCYVRKLRLCNSSVTVRI